ncbi:Glutathione S-transferase GST-6.0 [Pseudovibrio axinellae]|uniref:Glutathione S-transferase GST-6.0 n=1 Tax=Pseudovibrio axinellae TaxID=989403 RepID=A0A165YM69_9HYPH|nr:glutathione S-transferase family protein [Pseudovibrio axinellae]KZL18976.1 Glutathione S-transferase GST-6.0 [Pseudovibrio axinellae]SEP85445.1 glutathione S-transferase [Pseudovibrio axinellae]
MQLYYAPNTISIAVAIALEEAQLSYTTHKVDFKNPEVGRPELLKVNPKGRVPVLVTEKGILTEVGALLDYIAAMAPHAKLLPSDPFKAAKVREVMYYLASTMHVNHAHKLKGARWADKQESFEDMRAKVPETMTASCTYVEENLIAGPFVLGEAISIADAYLYMISTWLMGDGVDITPFPKFHAFQKLMEQRDSVKAVRAAGML